MCTKEEGYIIKTNKGNSTVTMKRNKLYEKNSHTLETMIKMPEHVTSL